MNDRIATPPEEGAMSAVRTRSEHKDRTYEPLDRPGGEGSDPADPCRALERERKMLEELIRKISHDLAQPVRGVASFGRLLHEECLEELSETGQQYLSLILRAGRQIEHSVQGWVRVARLVTRAEPLVSIDARVALDAAAARLRKDLASRDARIEIGPLPVVRADPTQLVLLFQELLQNSLQHCGEAAPQIAVTAEVDGPVAGRVTLRVADNCKGIDAADVPALFELLRSPDEQGELAHGFGLAVCQRIVMRVGGQLAIEARGGGGTVVSFDLPLGEPA